MKIKTTDINNTGASTGYVLTYNGTIPTWAPATGLTDAPSDGNYYVRLNAAWFNLNPVLTGYAPLSSPALTGNPTAPTQTAGNNSTRLATTAYADAISSALTTAINLKAPLASPSFTGSVTGPDYNATSGTINLGTTAGTQANFQLFGAAAVLKQFVYYTGSLPRWAVGSNAVAEAGSNAGSNFFVSRFNDAGTFLDSPLTINRATGQTVFTQDVRSNVSFTAFLNTSSGYVQLTPGNSTNTGYCGFFSAAGVRQGYVGFVPTSGALGISNDTGGGFAFTGGNVSFVNSDVTAYRTGGTTGVYYFHNGTTKYIYNDGSAFQVAGQGMTINGVTKPNGDNAFTLGASGFRWSVVWAGTATISTSDERKKVWRSSLTDAELSAAKQIASSIGLYQFKDSVAEKGSDARYHTGVLAQKVAEIMAANGLDATRYGFYCYDKWDETVTTDANGVETVNPAGDGYGVRYEEIAMFILAAQEQRLLALEAK